MSGIFGVIHWQGKPLEHTELNRMSSSLARRGPDAEGLWLDGAACLGHRMLHTTPESLHETLPFEDTASGLVISADARIDNREALCEALGISNQTRCDISDSYLILLAYKKWGEKCPGHLLGDFSFAIWDKNQQQLFCARDPIGIKPFYYFASDKLFAFASTVPAIRCLSVVPHDINEARIADFLVEALEGIDHTSTFFTTISRLPPANWLLTTKHNTTRQRYWAPVIDNSLTSLQEHESIEAFSEILTQSVHCRQRSLHPTAVMLSGGIDSASILGIARSISQLENNQTVHTFSAVDPQATSLDTACIQLIADQGDIQVHRVRPDQLSDYRENLDWILPNADEPFDHFMLIPQLMYITAREQGINNMMDGGDGDLAVSLSGPYIARLINSGCYRAAFGEATEQQRYQQASTLHGLKIFASALRLAFMPDAISTMLNQYRFNQQYNSLLESSLIRPEFADQINLKDRFASFQKCSHYNKIESMEEAHASRVSSPDVAVGCERYDRVAGYYGIEPRQPLLDRRLLDFTISISWDMKMRNGMRKYLLRKAVEDLLPPKVVWRTNKDHLVPQFQLSFFKMQQDIIDTALESTDIIDKYIDIKLLKTAFDRYRSNGNFRDGMTTWIAISLFSWLKKL